MERKGEVQSGSWMEKLGISEIPEEVSPDMTRNLEEPHCFLIKGFTGSDCEPHRTMAHKLRLKASPDLTPSNMALQSHITQLKTSTDPMWSDTKTRGGFLRR
ncbi:hypothetical protein NDU88_008075 [Pleurodeles waltl]|uniref:Uncharacterized protein n=1 Tax=Pleurodeles waltl TaxID=8319 RepID=A0AAV7U207_PLEWA|nr:hypothetical protein NDU88_008075 [Pleurodeles waltl]